MSSSGPPRELLDFIAASPTSFHAVDNISALLAANGFQELILSRRWKMPLSGRYFIRLDGSLIAFLLNSAGKKTRRLRMAGAHTDSPCLKLKPRSAQTNHGLLQLGVEPYGGALLEPWFDRDLALAGRLTWRDRAGVLRTSLIDFRRPVAFIPSLAIHLMRSAEKREQLNKQTDLVPVTMCVDNDTRPDFTALLARQLTGEHDLEVEPTILDHDLFLYDTTPPAPVGFTNDFIAGARLDNLLSCHCLIRALLDAGPDKDCLVILNDHEETGSLSTDGARGPFLQTVLERIFADRDTRLRTIARSLFISADNAHAVHPNFADRHDQAHLPRMNLGPVIKYNANQRYATTSRTAAFFRELAHRSNTPLQEFVMRSDLACGSTIGPITAGEIGVRTLDVGVPTLAMHSIRELAGTRDYEHLRTILQSFFDLADDDRLWQSLC